MDKISLVGNLRWHVFNRLYALSVSILFMKILTEEIWFITPVNHSDPHAAQIRASFILFFPLPFILIAFLIDRILPHI